VFWRSVLTVRSSSGHADVCLGSAKLIQWHSLLRHTQCIADSAPSSRCCITYGAGVTLNNKRCNLRDPWRSTLTSPRLSLPPACYTVPQVQSAHPTNCVHLLRLSSWRRIPPKSDKNKVRLSWNLHSSHGSGHQLCKIYARPTNYIKNKVQHGLQFTSFDRTHKLLNDVTWRSSIPIWEENRACRHVVKNLINIRHPV
jgi:hypothetical protein